MSVEDLGTKFQEAEHQAQAQEQLQQQQQQLFNSHQQQVQEVKYIGDIN